MWPFLQLRWNELETEDRTHVSYFMYQDLRESSVSTRRATQQETQTNSDILNKLDFFEMEKKSA